MKLRFRHAQLVLLTAGAALWLLLCPEVRGELVRAEMHGIVNSSTNSSQNGQSWTLRVVFVSSPQEVSFTASSPILPEFFNTGPEKVLRSLDFAIGDGAQFAIHLLDPVAAV